MTSSCWKLDNVIPKDLCEHIIARTNWDLAQEALVTKKDSNALVTDEQKRITKLVWEHQDSYIGCVIRTFFKYANEQAKWNFNIDDIEPIQLGKYDVNGHYDWHIDSILRENPNETRKLSATILLSNPADFEGGQFELEGAENQPSLQQGTMIVFPSYAKHRVAPVTSGVRYSAVGWAIGPAFK